MMEKRGFWATEADYVSGYTATLELEACLMATCLDELLARQDGLYRLVNTALFGQTYETDGLVPPTYTPSIEPFVSLDVLDQNSVMGRIDRLTQLIDNRIAGTATTLYTDTPGVKQQLEAIIAALGEGTDLTEVISELEAIALLLA
jgi:hypothetical protein